MFPHLSSRPLRWQTALRHFGCALLALTLGVGAALAASGEHPREYLLVTDFWPPFRIEGENGAMQGIDIELIAKLETRLKIKIRVQRVPWVRALGMMRDGTADLMSGLARTQERETFILYQAPAYAEIRPAFYQLATNAQPIKRYEDLAGTRIGFTRGSVYFEPFDSDNALNKLSATDETQLLRMLLGRRFDVIVGSDLQVDYELRQRGFASEVVKAAYRPAKTTPLYFGISRKSPLAAEASELGRALAELQADGTIAAILARYSLGGKAGERPATP